jgi:hypothetical protein
VLRTRPDRGVYVRNTQSGCVPAPREYGTVPARQKFGKKTVCTQKFDRGVAYTHPDRGVAYTPRKMCTLTFSACTRSGCVNSRLTSVPGWVGPNPSVEKTLGSGAPFRAHGYRLQTPPLSQINTRQSTILATILNSRTDRPLLLLSLVSSWSTPAHARATPVAQYNQDMQLISDSLYPTVQTAILVRKGQEPHGPGSD